MSLCDLVSIDAVRRDAEKLDLRTFIGDRNVGTGVRNLGQDLSASQCGAARQPASSLVFIRPTMI
jgi:hypothetical protein